MDSEHGLAWCENYKVDKDMKKLYGVKNISCEKYEVDKNIKNYKVDKNKNVWYVGSPPSESWVLLIGESEDNFEFLAERFPLTFIGIFLVQIYALFFFI